MWTVTGWCPELAEGLTFLSQVQWADEVVGPRNPWMETLQDRWVSAVAHIWSPEAVVRSAKALLDIGWVDDDVALQAAHIGGMTDTSRYPLTAELLGVCRAQPECWWHAHPEGFVVVLDKPTGQRQPIRGVVVWADTAAQQLVVLAVGSDGAPWTGVVWPTGVSREQLLAQLARLPGAGPTTLALASVLTMGVLGGLLAQLGGLVETVEVTTAAGVGLWSCLREELPVVAPTERPS